MLFLVLILPTIAVAQLKNKNSAKSLLKYLKQLDSTYHVGDHKDIVLVLGMAGSGATTLTTIETENGVRIVDEQTKSITSNLMLDALNDVAFYDLPGFSNSRNAEEELARIFVLRKLLNSVKSVKFLITIPYKSLLNRPNFIELAQNLADAMLDIEKYRNGIALMVVKVPSTEVQLDDDAKMIENIAVILQQIKDDSLKLDSIRQTEFMTNLIDILLEKSGNNYSRIGIMRRVNEAESLLDMPQLQNEKATISKIVNENLAYIRVNNDDFVYHESDAFANQTFDMIKELDNEMIVQFAIMSLEIKRFAMQQEKESANNLTVLIETFNSIYTKISQISSTDEPEVFKKQLIDVVNALRIILSNENTKKFLKNIEFLDFARTLLNNSYNFVREQSVIPNEIMNQPADLSAYFSDLKSFYDFLAELREKLSQYKIQNQKHKYDGSSLMELVIDNDFVKSKVIDLGIKYTINNIDPNLYSQIEYLPIDAIKLKQLQGIWNQSMQPISEDCSEDSKNLTVSGYNVMISDVIKSDCWPNATNIEIFAFNKVFLDVDIEKFSAYLSIIAPVWELVSIDGLPIKKIGVNGFNGRCSKHIPYAESYDAGPGGHFFGIGQKINDIYQLKIDVRGGRGMI